MPSRWPWSASDAPGVRVSTATAAVASGPSAAIKRVAVVGGGTMGNGIAQTFAASGFDVELIDVHTAAVDKALVTIGKSLDRLAQKQIIAPELAKSALERIHGGTSLEVASHCQVVVEAVSEEFALKRQVFETLDRVAPAGAVLASNTSSISITEIAAVTKRPDHVIGMHFMNPVPMMKLVEIIRGLATSDATWAAIEALTKDLGKVPVPANDAPGFIA